MKKAKNPKGIKLSKNHKITKKTSIEHKSISKNQKNKTVKNNVKTKKK